VKEKEKDVVITEGIEEVVIAEVKKEIP